MLLDIYRGEGEYGDRGGEGGKDMGQIWDNTSTSTNTNSNTNNKHTDSEVGDLSSALVRRKQEAIARTAHQLQYSLIRNGKVDPLPPSDVPWSTSGPSGKGDKGGIGVMSDMRDAYDIAMDRVLDIHSGRATHARTTSFVQCMLIGRNNDELQVSACVCVCVCAFVCDMFTTCFCLSILCSFSVRSLCNHHSPNTITNQQSSFTNLSSFIFHLSSLNFNRYLLH